MTITQVKPIFRIFDYDKAIDFYIHWLGFTIDWENRFEENTAVYMQVSRQGITLHLSEHHGDASPGAKAFVECTGLKEYHQLLIDKKYKYNRPALEESEWNSWTMTVIDPFRNQLLFSESKT